MNLSNSNFSWSKLQKFWAQMNCSCTLRSIALNWILVSMTFLDGEFKDKKICLILVILAIHASVGNDSFTPKINISSHQKQLISWTNYFATITPIVWLPRRRWIIHTLHQSLQKQKVVRIMQFRHQTILFNLVGKTKLVIQ